MATEYGTRLKTARNRLKLTQKQLEKMTGIPQSTISTAEKHGHGSTETTVYAMALKVDPHWLATGEGEMELTGATGVQARWVEENSQPVLAIGDEESLPGYYIQVKESAVRFSAGPGRALQFEEDQESFPVSYRRDWFIKEGMNPDKTKRFKVHGDSMESLLHDGDSVLVNLVETDVVNGKVYAIRYGDELRIKRLYRRLDGGLILHSDNPKHLPRDEEIAPSQVDEYITIIGRVRDKSGRGGL